MRVLHLAARVADPVLLGLLLAHGSAGAAGLRAVDAQGRVPMEYAWYGAARALKELGVEGFENINRCWVRFDEKAHAVLNSNTLAQYVVAAIAPDFLVPMGEQTGETDRLAFNPQTMAEIVEGFLRTHIPRNEPRLGARRWRRSRPPCWPR